MEDANINDVMKAYAHDAVEAAARHNVMLDYSEQSLNEVDKLLGKESFIGQTPRVPWSPEDEGTMWMLSKMMGAYIGEVAIRIFSGQWLSEPTPEGGIRPVIDIRGVKGFPVEKVWKRLTESGFDSLGGYCRALRAILERRASNL